MIRKCDVGDQSRSTTYSVTGSVIKMTVFNVEFCFRDSKYPVFQQSVVIGFDYAVSVR